MTFLNRQKRPRELCRAGSGYGANMPTISFVDLASLQIRMARSENLPVLPQAVSAILRLADDPNASQRDLEKAFERDPAITAKILRVANSAYYGGANIPSIGRAISFLGMSTIRSLVVGVAFQQVVGSKAACRNFDKLAYWRHSLATGIAARLLGKLKLPSKAEELYCTGIMHDIGMLVLERFLPEEFEKAIELSLKAGVTLHEAESTVLGFDHASVGGLLAEKWGLTEIMRAGIDHHHSPKSETKYPEVAEITETANLFAYACGFANQGTIKCPSNEQLSEMSGLAIEQIPVIVQVIQAEVEKAESSMQIAA